MSDLKDDLKKEWEASKENLKSMRDELRLKLHLASMDAKDKYAKLDEEAEKLMKQLEEGFEKTTKAVVDEMTTRLSELRDDLFGKKDDKKD